ncbi:MAG TPA: helix-turn-helix domain-containing protein, partial [Streptosporangiaceae bacterium]|nr:helix-turn-helix domain-containing protein [Streptosporangiaceae bacterium]
SPVLAHVISSSEFIAFLGRHAEAWPSITGMIADRLEWANQRRLDFAGYSVPERLARVLVALTERHGYSTEGGHDLGVRLSQEEMGKLIGAGRDAIAKAVGLLKSRGLISTQYRGIVIADLTGLRKFAELDS